MPIRTRLGSIQVIIIQNISGSYESYTRLRVRSIYVSSRKSLGKNWMWSRREGSGYVEVHLKHHQYRPCRFKWGEKPLRIRRIKLMLAYWVNLQGHKQSHPSKNILEECWEHNKTNFRSFGWIGNSKAISMGLSRFEHS